MARRSFVAKGKWSGNRSINAIVTDYKNFVGVVNSEVERIMQGAADMTLEATLPYVPVETGALKESGVARTIKTSKGVMAVVSFGGDNTPVKPTKNAPAGFVDYAVVVNYDTAKAHPNGEAMFLEKGSLESKSKVDAYIMNELRKIKI